MTEAAVPASGAGVPITDLPALAGDKSRITSEYRELHGQLEKYISTGKHVCTSAQMPANSSANRYMNVLAFEPTRVKLLISDGVVTRSDYINANYIDGIVPNSEKAYIGTQGPLEETQDAFWHMVWDTNASVIVMLTKLIENGTPKCHHYWPSKKDGHKRLYGSVEVQISSVSELQKNGRKTGLVLRKATLRKGKESRRVYHYQLVAWADAGVPSSTTEVLHLIEEVNRVNPPGSTIVVHCSAGIGRTGTFILVHAVMQHVEHALRSAPDTVPTVNLFQALLKLRQCKPMLVQTMEQYEFCYRCVGDGVQQLLQKKQAL